MRYRVADFYRLLKRHNMRLSLFRSLTILTIAMAVPALSQQSLNYTVIAPPRQPDAIPLGAVPSGTPDHEQWMLQNGIIGVRNFTVLTLTPVLPAGNSTKAAMIVAPGSAFLGLAIDHEGWQVARWLGRYDAALDGRYRGA